MNRRLSNGTSLRSTKPNNSITSYNSLAEFPNMASKNLYLSLRNSQSFEVSKMQTDGDSTPFMDRSNSVFEQVKCYATNKRYDNFFTDERFSKSIID